MQITNCKLSKRVQKKLLEFFVLQVTACSATELGWIPKISAAEWAVTWSTKIRAVLSVLFSLICSALSSYFEGDITANLVQPLVK